MQFEKRGIPTTLIVTDAFESVARRLLKSLGYPDVPILVTPNPVIYLDAAQINERIDGLLDPIVESFGTAPVRGAHGKNA